MLALTNWRKVFYLKISGQGSDIGIKYLLLIFHAIYHLQKYLVLCIGHNLDANVVLNFLNGGSPLGDHMVKYFMED